MCRIFCPSLYDADARWGRLCVLDAGELIRRVRKILVQLLDAVEYIHSKNIIHRDLKLDNILFTSTNLDLIKVADFGVCFPKTDSRADPETKVGFRPDQVLLAISGPQSSMLVCWFWDAAWLALRGSCGITFLCLTIQGTHMGPVW